jgi:hypothetical protein
MPWANWHVKLLWHDIRKGTRSGEKIWYSWGYALDTLPLKCLIYDIEEASRARQMGARIEIEAWVERWIAP